MQEARYIDESDGDEDYIPAITGIEDSEDEEEEEEENEIKTKVITRSGREVITPDWYVAGPAGRTLSAFIPRQMIGEVGLAAVMVEEPSVCYNQDIQQVID